MPSRSLSVGYIYSCQQPFGGTLRPTSPRFQFVNDVTAKHADNFRNSKNTMTKMPLEP